MNMVNKIGLLAVVLIGVIVFCKLGEKKLAAQEIVAPESQAAGTYGLFSGYVRNYDTGKPVYMAKVKFINSNGQLDQVQYTDSTGRYNSTRIWNGTYRIEVSKVSFITKSRYEYTCCMDITQVDFRLRKVQ